MIPTCALVNSSGSMYAGKEDEETDADAEGEDDVLMMFENSRESVRHASVMHVV